MEAKTIFLTLGRIRYALCIWAISFSLIGCGTPKLTIDDMYDRASVLCDQGRGEEALQILDQIKEDNPHPRAFYLRGVAHELSFELEQAIDSYGQCLQRAPNDSDALNNRGSVYYRIGQLEAAEKDLLQATQFNPSDHLAWSNLSLVFQKLGRWDEAVSAVRRANALRGSAIYLLQLGNLLLQQHKAEEAEQALSESLKLNSHNASAYLSRALANMQMGRSIPATGDLELARRYDVGLALHQMIEITERQLQGSSDSN